MSTQRKLPTCTCPQPTLRTPLLPTPPAPARQHIRKTLILGPPPHSNNQYQYKQYISRLPNAAINNRQCSPLLPIPTQRLVITRPRLLQHLQGQFTPQVPIYLPVLVITLMDQFTNLLANQTQFKPQLWSTHTYWEPRHHGEK